MFTYPKLNDFYKHFFISFLFKPAFLKSIFDNLKYLAPSQFTKFSFQDIYFIENVANFVTASKKLHDPPDNITYLAYRTQQKIPELQTLNFQEIRLCLTKKEIA